MAACMAHNALWLTRCARGIENIGGVVTLYGHARRGRNPVLEAIPIDIAPIGQACHFLFALKDHAEIWLMGGGLNGRIQKWFIMHHAARLEATGGGDDTFGLR